MRFSKEKNKEIIGKIKQVLIYNPTASVPQITRALEIGGYKLNIKTVDGFIKKIRGERAMRYNNASIKEAIAKFEDFKLLIDQILHNIIDNTTHERIKIEGLKQLVKQYRDLLVLQLDVGVFSKPKDKEKNTDQPECTNIAEILRIIENAKKIYETNKAKEAGEIKGFEMAVN